MNSQTLFNTRNDQHVISLMGCAFFAIQLLITDVVTRMT
jgi:hypothetical protein